MLARIRLKDVPHSSFFHASGRDQPDKYRFEVVQGQEHLVERIIPIEQLSKESTDFLNLYSYADTPVLLEFIPEERDATGAAGRVVLEQKAKIEALEKSAQSIREEYKKALNLIDQLKAQPAEGSKAARITDDELARLGLYDGMIAVLSHVSQEMETPLDTVIRLVRGQQPAKQPETAEVSADVDKGDNGVFDENTRRAELQKLTEANINKLAKDIPDTEGLSVSDKIEAILLHEAAA